MSIKTNLSNLFSCNNCIHRIMVGCFIYFVNSDIMKHDRVLFQLKSLQLYSLGRWQSDRNNTISSRMT